MESGTSRTLQVRNDADTIWSDLSAYTDLERDKIKKDLSEWFEGISELYISCYAKPAPASKQDTSYLVIRKTENSKSKSDHYSISCVPRRLIHKKDRELMRFMLVPYQHSEELQAGASQSESSVQQQAADAAIDLVRQDRRVSVAAEIHPQ